MGISNSSKQIPIPFTSLYMDIVRVTGLVLHSFFGFMLTI